MKKKTILKTTAITALALGLLASPFAAGSLTAQSVNDHADAAADVVEARLYNQPSPNEIVGNRYLDTHDGFRAVEFKSFPMRYTSMSLTWSNSDGSPLKKGSFRTEQRDDALWVLTDEVPPGEYTVKLSDLSPSELEGEFIFNVRVLEP